MKSVRPFVKMMPEMASKKDSRHGIGYCQYGVVDAMSGIVFTPWSMTGVEKLTNYIPAITQPTSADKASN